MSSVAFIDPDRDQRWDAFVEAHPDGLIYHLSGWRQVLERSFSHIKGCFPVLLDATTGGIRAGMPIYLVSSPFLGKRLVSIPFATLSDPLATSHEEMQELLSAAINLAKCCRAQRIEIRCHRAIILPTNPRYQIIDPFKHHFLPLDKPVEGLWKRLHRTSVRPLVKRAEKNGLELRAATSSEDLQCFYKLFVGVRKRLGLPPQPFSFFEQLWRVFGPSGKCGIVQAYYKGMPIGSLLVLKFKNRVSAEFIGIEQGYSHLNVSHFLYWQAILQAHAAGYEIFDFGRTSPNNLGLMAFKKHWGTTVTDLPQFWYPPLSAATLQNSNNSLMYHVGRNLLRKSPESLLRLLGELCYRHMG